MSVKRLSSSLYYLPRPNRWMKGIGAELPVEYKKFWKEWKLTKPTAVHYVKQEGRYIRDEETEVVRPVQNVPLPLLYPKEHNQGIWGGEAVIQGYMKKSKYHRRFPHFWFPMLKKTILYSEVLDKYMRTVVTDRTLNLIHEHYGFDHYLLKTPACDLISELAVKLKRQILLALVDKTLYPNDPDKREEIYNKYKEYLTAYTRDEIEWYGLTYKEACLKWIKLKDEQNPVQPLKLQYRAELIASLQEESKKQETEKTESMVDSTLSWISKVNPFSKDTKSK
ncbi:mitochondrial ribosomal protein L28 [Nomia melanderi]|uniref:mitochondrial ribosomal protein L28 n=1 Tax=Nomia melanderi TaxID=2448451 RepID=UPI001303FBE1|nr:39S ribosomal protein L28, mitochondrial [Nomia melanderi]